MQRPSSHSSMSELQKRYTERAKLKSEEQDLMRIIEKTKTQLTQLQAEAVDIKSKIKPIPQKEDKNNSLANKNKANAKNDTLASSSVEQEELELDLDTTNDVLEKMLKGQFSTIDAEEGVIN